VRVVVVVVVVVPNYTPWTMMVVCNAPRRAFAVKKHAVDDLCFASSTLIFFVKSDNKNV